MQFLKVCAVVTMSDNNELGYITRARRDAADMDAIESFKKDFNFDKPESGVAILCVCDRLLQLFQDYGIKQIEQFVNQKMVDEQEEWELVENYVALGAEVKFHAQFDTCIKAFFDSLDLLFNASMAKEYYVPANGWDTS
jgi:type I restriction enzyme R subunit